VCIPHRSISRKHARLTRSDDGWRVEDLGSLNGTRVRGRSRPDHVLVHGDRILLHDLEIEFLDGDAPESTPFAPASTMGGTLFRAAVDFGGLTSRDGGEVGRERLSRVIESMGRTSEAILRAGDLDATLDAMLDVVFDAFPARRAFILLQDDALGGLVPRRARQDAGQGTPLQVPRAIAEKVVRERVAVLTSDAQNDVRFGSRESVIALGVRSAMAAPLWNGDRVEGLIYLDSADRARAFDEFDLDLLSSIGNYLATAVARARLQESYVRQEVLRSRLERYHSPAVVERVRGLVDTPEDLLVADEREVTVLFADMVGFSGRCEVLGPRIVSDVLNAFFGELAEAVFEHGGTLDKFIGDCLMAVFGAPLADPQHARKAVDCALDMSERLDRLNARGTLDERILCRIAVHSGPVVAGDFGSRDRREYTVLGSTVNIAARLESEVAGAGETVLSASTWNLVADACRGRPLGERRLRGILQPVACWELLGRVAGAEVESTDPPIQPGSPSE